MHDGWRSQQSGAMVQSEHGLLRGAIVQPSGRRLLLLAVSQQCLLKRTACLILRRSALRKLSGAVFDRLTGTIKRVTRDATRKGQGLREAECRSLRRVKVWRDEFQTLSASRRSDARCIVKPRLLNGRS